MPLFTWLNQMHQPLNLLDVSSSCSINLPSRHSLERLWFEDVFDLCSTLTFAKSLLMPLCHPFTFLRSSSHIKAWCAMLAMHGCFKQEIIACHVVVQYMYFYGGHFDFQDGGQMKMKLVNLYGGCLSMSDTICMDIFENLKIQKYLQPDILVKIHCYGGHFEFQDGGVIKIIHNFWKRCISMTSKAIDY